jgi:hypothetical protein
MSLGLISTSTIAQSTLKEYKAGHTFTVSLPDYMTKTVGLNDVAAIQYKSVVKDVYGFVIFDTKEELEIAEIKYSSINEFYEDFIEDFLKDQDKRKISKSVSGKNDGINFIESEASYYDKELNIEISYLVGIVETKNSYYKVISWSSIENKDKFKSDFQKIIYSIRD